MNTNTMELNLNEMEMMNGGLIDSPLKVIGVCEHDHTVRTGREREDSRFFFWSKHQHEYHCNDCGLNIWYDED